jgi:hypothetical protein
MSLSAIILGLIDIAIVIVILVLVGAVILWILGYLGWAPPPQVQKLYLAVVALIALYMLVALLFGIPSIRLFHAAVPLAPASFRRLLIKGSSQTT